MASGESVRDSSAAADVLLASAEHRHPDHVEADRRADSGGREGSGDFGDPPKTGTSRGGSEHHDTDVAGVSVERGAERLEVGSERGVRRLGAQWIAGDDSARQNTEQCEFPRAQASHRGRPHESATAAAANQTRRRAEREPPGLQAAPATCGGRWTSQNAIPTRTTDAPRRTGR